MKNKFHYLFYLVTNIINPTHHEIHKCILPPRKLAMQAANLDKIYKKQQH